jgi:tetratricopeptide (TPR) repeat protein
MGTSSKRSNLAQIVLAAFVAFAVGALVVWVILSSHRQNPQDLATPSSAVAPSPPDTAGLAPGQAALAMANWYFDNHTWPKAIDEYEKAISLGLDNADLRTDLGSAYRFSGQNAKAIEQYEIAQRENPQHENSLFNLAALYLQTAHEPAKATELLEDFRKRFPKSGALPRVQELLDEAKTEMSNAPVRGGK